MLSKRQNVAISLVCRDQKPRFKLDLNFVWSVALVKSFHLCLPPLASLISVTDSRLKHSVPVAPISPIIINRGGYSLSTSHHPKMGILWALETLWVWQGPGAAPAQPPSHPCCPEKRIWGIMSDNSLLCSQFLYSLWLFAELTS